VFEAKECSVPAVVGFGQEQLHLLRLSQNFVFITVCFGLPCFPLVGLFCGFKCVVVWPLLQA
jgi:hypothetical protein